MAENIEQVQPSDQVSYPDIAAATLKTGDKTNLKHAETSSKIMGVSKHMGLIFCLRTIKPSHMLSVFT